MSILTWSPSRTGPPPYLIDMRIWAAVITSIGGSSSAALAALAAGGFSDSEAGGSTRCPHRFFLLRHSAHAGFLFFTSASEALKKNDISMWMNEEREKEDRRSEYLLAARLLGAILSKRVFGVSFG